MRLVKAILLTMKIAATPSATALVWTIKPVQRPRVIITPDFPPYSADCVSTKILSGPGARESRVEARIKVVSGSAFALTTRLSCDGRSRDR